MRILRDYIKGLILAEAKVNIKPEEYAMAFLPLNGHYHFVLFDLESFHDLIDMPRKMHLLELLEACVCGYALVEPDPFGRAGKRSSAGGMYGAYELINFAARPGLGPDFCDFVMAIILKFDKAPMVLDREEVSAEMESLANYYLHNRQDVEKLLIDNMYDDTLYPRTGDTSDDGWPSNDRQYDNDIRSSGDPTQPISYKEDSLNYVYKLNNSSIEEKATQVMNAFDEKMAPTIEDRGNAGGPVSYSALAQRCQQAGSRFFMARYTGEK